MRRLLAMLARPVDDARARAHIRHCATAERRTLRMLNDAWRLP